jgi:hypothetical protein
MSWKPKELTFETTLDFDDEQDVDVIIYVKPGFEYDDDWEIIKIELASDGSQLILTSNLTAEAANYVSDHFGEAWADAEGDYTDYRYELYRDDMMREDF